MTKILLVAEGKNEHGDQHKNSALAILVHRLCNNSPMVEFEHCKVNDQRFRRYRPRGKGIRYAQVIAGFLRGAEIRGIDAVVFLIDEDGDPERRRAVNDGQTVATPTLPRACGVAIRSFDAWMLADENAIGQALGIPVQRQAEPEQQRYPKQDCRRLQQQSPCRLQPSQVYADIARNTDLERLAQRCPGGFAPFAQRIVELGRQLGLDTLHDQG